jgi:hypothetical protein
MIKGDNCSAHLHDAAGGVQQTSSEGTHLEMQRQAAAAAAGGGKRVIECACMGYLTCAGGTVRGAAPPSPPTPCNQQQQQKRAWLRLRSICIAEDGCSQTLVPLFPHDNMLASPRDACRI